MSSSDDYNFDIPVVSAPKKDEFPRWVSRNAIEIAYGETNDGLRWDGTKIIGPRDREWDYYSKFLTSVGVPRPSVS